MSKKNILFLLRFLFNIIFIVVAIIVVKKAVTYAYDFAYEYVSKSSDENKNIKEIEVKIPTGATTESIADILEKNGLIDNTNIFRITSRLLGNDGKYKHGIFILNTSMDDEEIMKHLMSSGDLAEGNMVTIPEGYNIKQIVSKLGDEDIIDEEEFYNSLENMTYDYEFIKYIPNRENKYEGYLFPDTYEINKDTDEKIIVSKMLNRFDNIFKAEYYDRAKKIGLSIDDIIIIASIIEKEAKLESEREIISGVIYNRIRENMNLEMCSTVLYALGRTTGELSNRDTEIESLYNTYKYLGLPKGPICNPGEASIRAALYPQEHDYYYFVLMDEETGEHHFSETYREHINAKNKYNQ